MKNKLFYLSLLAFTALVFSSCAARYGCPNSHIGAIKPQPQFIQSNV